MADLTVFLLKLKNAIIVFFLKPLDGLRNTRESIQKVSEKFLSSKRTPLPSQMNMNPMSCYLVLIQFEVAIDLGDSYDKFNILISNKNFLWEC